MKVSVKYLDVSYMGGNEIRDPSTSIILTKIRSNKDLKLLYVLSDFMRCRNEEDYTRKQRMSSFSANQTPWGYPSNLRQSGRVEIQSSVKERLCENVRMDINAFSHIFDKRLETVEELSFSEIQRILSPAIEYLRKNMTNEIKLRENEFNGNCKQKYLYVVEDELGNYIGHGYVSDGSNKDNRVTISFYRVSLLYTLSGKDISYRYNQIICCGILLSLRKFNARNVCFILPDCSSEEDLTTLRCGRLTLDSIRNEGEKCKWFRMNLFNADFYTE